MRPIRLDLDVADASLTGFASNVTGTAFTITTTATSDGLAHRVSIRNDSANDHSGKTVALVGTDADGKAQSETVTGPAGSATVESTKYFRTLTSATPSASVADTFDIGWVDEVSSITLPLDYYQPKPPTIQIVVTGTINFDVEVCNQNPLARVGGDNPEDAAPFTFTDQSDLDWVNDANFTAKTATLVDDLALPGMKAMKIVINSYTNSAELQVYITQPY